MTDATMLGLAAVAGVVMLIGLTLAFAGSFRQPRHGQPARAVLPHVPLSTMPASMPNAIRMFVTSSGETDWVTYGHEYCDLPHLTEDTTECFLIDKIRHTHLRAESGQEAVITWRYDRARVLHFFSTPKLNFAAHPPTKYYGHTPKGISDDFECLVREWYYRGDEHLYTGERLQHSQYIYYGDVTEAGIRQRATGNPIEILKVEITPAPASGRGSA